MSSTSKFSFELPEIFKWRNPIESGLALLSLNLIYLSCFIQNVGLIYILTNYSFWFVISAAAYLKIKSILAGSSAATATSAKEDDYVFVSDETCQKIVLVVNEIASYFAQQLKIAADFSDITSLIKFLAGLYLLSIIGLIVSVQTLIWLTLNGLFVYSFIQHNTQAKQIVTPLFDTVNGMVKQYSQLIYSKIPRYTAQNQ